MIILHTEASGGWGGQEIRILRESAGMRARGHKVMIAAHPESALFLNAGKEGFRTIPVVFRRRGFFHIVPFLKKLIEKEKIDVVNTHSSKDSWLALPAARLAGNRPLVLRTRHLSTPVHRGPLNRLLYDRLPHYVITTGRAIKDQLVNDNGFNADRIISIPTGVDTGIYNPQHEYADLRDELSLPKDSPLAGMVSVLRSWKGHVHFIKAIPHVIKERPDARFVIAGEGPYRPTIEKAVDEVNVREYVYFLGHREDIASVMSSLDVLVHPSYANEGVPQSLLQAMAMRIPVIASDLAPLKEIVEHGRTGLIVPVNAPEILASKIIYLLRHKEEADIMCKNARSMVETGYSLERMLDSMESLYLKR